MRVVLDTNIFISALISPAGAPGRIIKSWLDRRFLLVSHMLQIDELREISRRKKVRRLIRPAEAGRIVNDLIATAQMPDALPPVERSPDPNDDFLLALCEASHADWLITGDKEDLLALGRHGRARIVTASSFAATLKLT